jgi:hypothetical protein
MKKNILKIAGILLHVANMAAIHVFWKSLGPGIFAINGPGLLLTYALLIKGER